MFIRGKFVTNSSSSSFFFYSSCENDAEKLDAEFFENLKFCKGLKYSPQEVADFVNETGKKVTKKWLTKEYEEMLAWLKELEEERINKERYYSYCSISLAAERVMSYATLLAIMEENEGTVYYIEAEDDGTKGPIAQNIECRGPRNAEYMNTGVITINNH